ncbi:hypothetical protein [Nitrososphaera viennensis]|uniref:Uncharacterized protein n=1 Tax=Nitrososphaera viennensis TaxID=1034015 RepID=A0A977IG35_9ARCH|nr:hypothetical protein [Nitrososphaera viennensis]UVS70379.1 hypothetical protein NWT39_06235 [Nitrososphaera viennensis]
MVDYNALCLRILEADSYVRFAGVADQLGKMVASQYRKNVQPLLTKEESELSATQSILRMGTRLTLESKLGPTVYSFALYERVKRATIPVRDPGNHCLLVSFDVVADHEEIILEKILPLLKS